VDRLLLPKAAASRHLHLLPPLSPRPSLVFQAAVRANLAVMSVVALRLLATVVRRALRAHQAPPIRAPTQEAPARSHRAWRLVAAPTTVAELLQAALLRLWPSLLLP